MARRARNTRTAARWIDWTPAMAEYFRLACDSWTPPKQARLTGGRHRQTLSARFTRPDGAVMTARLRLARDCATGERYVVAEELSLPTLTIRGAEV